MRRENLEEVVRTRTIALQQALEWLERSERNFVSRERDDQRPAIAAEYRDSSTAQHIQRMSHYCELLARRYGLSPERCDLIRTASPCMTSARSARPIMFCSSPASSHRKNSRSSQHTEIGYRILAGSTGTVESGRPHRLDPP